MSDPGAQAGQISPDGQWQWDGTQWQPVSGQSSQSSGDGQSSSATVGQVSPDGHWQWDGTQWQPVASQAAPPGGVYDEQSQVCRYPTVYMQDGAAAQPGSPYQQERSGVSAVEIAEITTHLATMAPDAAKAATSAARMYSVYSAEGTSAALADSAAAEMLAASGAFAIGAVILLITMTEDQQRNCGDVCPTCTQSDNSTSDWLEEYLCTLLERHSDQHCCPSQHTWIGTPIGHRVHDGQESWRR